MQGHADGKGKFRLNSRTISGLYTQNDTLMQYASVFVCVCVCMCVCVCLCVCVFEQAGFRAGRSTTEQIFNLRTLSEKYIQHQQDLYHIFIDFKKAFDRVWHAALWATMKKYNISTNLMQVIKNLYDKATSAVLLNSSIGDWFRTTVGV